MHELDCNDDQLQSVNNPHATKTGLNETFSHLQDNFKGAEKLKIHAQGNGISEGRREIKINCGMQNTLEDYTGCSPLVGHPVTHLQWNFQWKDFFPSAN